MTVENVSLTRTEAETRASLIRSCEYAVELDLAQGPDRYRFAVRLEFLGTPGAKTFIDAQVDRVDGINWQGAPLDLGAYAGQRIELPPLEASNVLEVSGSSPYHRTGLGLHLAIDPSDNERYLYTDLEPAEAHRVFPCFDQPDLKGRFSFRIRVPQDWTVVSTEQGRPGPDAEGARWWSFEPTSPLSPYVLGIVAGRLHAIHQQHGDIPLSLYAPLSLAQDLEKAAPDIFEVTRQGLDFYRERFGIPYPFSKYDQAFCLEKVNGAMESPGCVTITDRMIYRGQPSPRERSLRAEVILHEMAHMWFGDLVTLRWWDDLWLNESFATFMAAVAQDRATSFDDAWTYWATAFKQLAVEEDQHTTSHPVVTAVPDAEAVHLNFDRITYQKGAAVLRQLAAWVGEEPFFAAIHSHLASHRDGNAQFRDLVSALEVSSGRDVAAWSRAWLETVGINTLRCEVESAPEAVGGEIQSVQVMQSASQSQPTLRPHRIGIGLYDWEQGKLELMRRLEVDVEGSATAVAELAGSKRPALILPNDGALSYAKLRLDPISQLTMEGHLGEVSDSLARALLWDGAWDMVRDAEMPGRRFVQMVVAHLPQERDQSLIPVVLGGARAALSTYVAPAWGDQLEAMLAAAAQRALATSPPRSPDQVAWLRAFISSASAPDQVDRCRAMLGGEQLPEGVVVDLELRWRLVTALCARGAAGDGEITDMLSADSTSTGQVRALAARAAMPSSSAKEDVFRFLTEDESATVEATIWVGRSFSGVRREDLLLPFIPRFFTAVDSLGQSRGPEYSRDLAYWFFPSLPPHRMLVEAIEEQFQRPDLRPDLRRIYQDGLEEAQRAIRARELDQRTPAELPALGE
ncbi:MAG: aminopeptidase N [Candidatus Dormibacteria bacterium]